MTDQSNFRDLKEASAKTLRADQLSTNVTTHSHAVHRWFNFIAGFSPEFIKGCISLTGQAPETLLLLDPFSGCGTAPLAARLQGTSAVAYEAHPFFAKISEAKVNSFQCWPRLVEISLTIERGIHKKDENRTLLPTAAEIFLGKLFHKDDLTALLSARNALETTGLAGDPLAFLVLSRVLDHVCLAATNGIYKAPTSTKRSLSPKAALSRVVSQLTDDAKEALIHAEPSLVYSKSSESMVELTNDCVDLAVTSPPYLNNFDFAEMTRMYLYFWGMASSWGEITEKVRSRLIVNTTTALKGHKSLQEKYRASTPETIRKSTDDVVALLAKRKNEKAGKKDYDLLIYPYLSQMQQVLRETLRVLKPGASIHMMVSDAALYGVHLQTPHWLSEIMRQIGFSDVQCEMVRPRGHRWILEKREGSVRGLGEYYVSGRSV